MMLPSVILFSVLAFVIAAPNTSTDLTSTEEKIFDDFLEMDVEKYINRFVEEASDQICVAKNINFQIPFEEVLSRLGEILSNEEIVETLTVCTMFKTKFPYVVEPLVKIIEKDCLPKEFSGAAEYIVEALVSAVSQICAFTGEELLELTNPCFLHISVDQIQDWFEDVDSSKSISGPFKEELCKIYIQVKPSVVDTINDKCKLQITRRSAVRLLDSILKEPCDT